jgi:hypothetical protein
MDLCRLRRGQGEVGRRRTSRRGSRVLVLGPRSSYWWEYNMSSSNRVDRMIKSDQERGMRGVWR